MSLPTRLPDVIDAAVAMFTTAIVAGEVLAAEGGAVVLDGPVVRDEPKRYVVVGDEAEDEESDVTIERSWAGLGAQALDEVAQIPCSAIAWTGDTDLSTRRREAFELYSACEAAHRANLNFGGLVLFSGITDVTYRPYVNENGTGARVRFTIEYKARI